MIRQRTLSHKGSIGMLCLLIMSLTLSSCGGGGNSEPEQTPQEIAQELLEGIWSLENGSIVLDDSDDTDKYAGFTIDFGDGSFNTTNAGNLFPASGTWEWVGDTDNQITTERGKDITFSTLTDDLLVFTFIKTTTNAVAGASGTYSITLNK